MKTLNEFIVERIGTGQNDQRKESAAALIGSAPELEELAKYSYSEDSNRWYTKAWWSDGVTFKNGGYFIKLKGMSGSQGSNGFYLDGVPASGLKYPIKNIKITDKNRERGVFMLKNIQSDIPNIFAPDAVIDANELYFSECGIKNLEGLPYNVDVNCLSFYKCPKLKSFLGLNTTGEIKKLVFLNCSGAVTADLLASIPEKIKATIQEVQIRDSLSNELKKMSPADISIKFFGQNCPAHNSGKVIIY